MKISGIVCLILCAICLFVAVERYNANAGNVRAMQTFNITGMELKPATPAVTKYAVFFAVLTGVGGGILLAKSRK